MALIETFDNQYPDREYTIEIDCPEFTSVCPITGNPDFGTITICYIPAERCLELKSLKLYLFEYRNEGVFYEALVNRILDDVVASCRPRRATVKGAFRPRGGITSVVTATYGGGELPAGGTISRHDSAFDAPDPSSSASSGPFPSGAPEGPARVRL